MTKLDQVWAQGIRDSVNALISEVERLEAVGETLEAENDALRKSIEDAKDLLTFERNEKIHAQEQLIELRTPMKDWDKKLAEKNAALTARNVEIAVLTERIKAYEIGEVRYLDRTRQLEDCAAEMREAAEDLKFCPTCSEYNFAEINVLHKCVAPFPAPAADRGEPHKCGDDPNCCDLGNP